MQNFSHLMQGKHFLSWRLNKEEGKVNEKLSISRKRWKIRLRFLLITNRKYVLSDKKDKNRWSWTTLNVVTRYCGWTVRDMLLITNLKWHI